MFSTRWNQTKSKWGTFGHAIRRSNHARAGSFRLGIPSLIHRRRKNLWERSADDVTLADTKTEQEGLKENQTNNIVKIIFCTEYSSLCLSEKAGGIRPWRENWQALDFVLFLSYILHHCPHLLPRQHSRGWDSWQQGWEAAWHNKQEWLLDSTHKSGFFNPWIGVVPGGFRTVLCVHIASFWLVWRNWFTNTKFTQLTTAHLKFMWQQVWQNWHHGM